ncbi:MAG: hypothetical protein RL748_2069 [Pseudomonadota bacterium]
MMWSAFKRVSLKFFSAIGLMIVASGVSAIEEPSYKVIKKYAEFEVREYAPYIVAEVTVPGPADKAGSTAFGYLGGYIFGKNKGAKKIEMTAPVSQQQAQTPVPIKIEMTAPVIQKPLNQEFVVQFTMPKSFTMDTLPEPNDPRVKLREVPSQTLAVITYSGSWSQSLYDEKLATLRKALQDEGMKTQGEAIFSRYNGPVSLPFLRRNEIWLELL